MSNVSKKSDDNPDFDRPRLQLEAHYKIARVLAEASSVNSAAQEIIQIVCELLTWELGALWLVDPALNMLRCEQVSYRPDQGFEAFVSETKKQTFQLGQGLPGRVWKTQRPEVVADVSVDPNFPRAQAAGTDGIHGAAAFPLTLGGRILGVMEFFGRSIASPDTSLLKMMANIGSQMGQFIERRRAEQDVLDREEQYRLLAATASDVLISIDHNSTIQFANVATKRIFGYAPEELIGKSLTMLMPDRLRPRHLAQIARYIETGERRLNWSAVEVQGRRKDGTEFPIEVSFGSIERHGRHTFTGIIRDISERKRAEADRKKAEQIARDAEQRFHIMADNAPVMIWMSGADTKFTYVNNGYLAFTGRTLAQELGDGWLEEVAPDEQVACRAEFARNFELRRELRIEYRLRQHDGEFRWVLSHGVPLHSPDGTFTGYIGSCIDIHERKQKEIRDVAARQEAEHANRMKDEFLATISHELRTPLTPILGWARILRGSTPDSEHFARGIDVIERNARTQVALIEDLLDVSRIITGRLALDLKPTGLAPIVEVAMDSVRPAAESKKIELRFVMDASPGLVMGDKSRLQQILWNLLSNAVKFTPSGGRIEIQLIREEKCVVIKVIDTGCGIVPEYLPHVFDRFSQADSSTSRKVGGLGIGLSIVKHLAELHGGTVEAYSEGSDRGATFTVRLPRSRTVIMQAKPTPPFGMLSVHGRPQKLHGLKVLVVDDEPDARQFIEFVLQQWGGTVRAAESVQGAMELLKTFTPDVVVSDIGMPLEDGYVLIRRLRASGMNIPALALTAFARGEDRDRALAEGFQHHMPKPVEPEELADTVARLARQSA